MVKLGVAVYQGGRLAAGLADQVLVPQQREQPKGGSAAGLGRAEHIALPPLLQVQLCELKTIEGRGDCVKSFS